jgi:hypothetical protein
MGNIGPIALMSMVMLPIIIFLVANLINGIQEYKNDKHTEKVTGTMIDFIESHKKVESSDGNSYTDTVYIPIVEFMTLENELLSSKDEKYTITTDELNKLNYYREHDIDSSRVDEIIKVNLYYDPSNPKDIKIEHKNFTFADIQRMFVAGNVMFIAVTSIFYIICLITMIFY